MKATELMIGDIAYVVKEYEDCNEEVVVEKFPARITAIDENGLLGMDEKNGFMCEVLGDCGDFDEFDDIEPIELTAEILKKNRFERNEYFDYNVCIYFSFPTGVVTKRSGFGIEKRDNEYYITDHVLMPMRYVHELQHALRLCGFNDLANNFKI